MYANAGTRADLNSLIAPYDPVFRAANDHRQRKFDEDVKAGRASNTSGSMFSDEFMRNVTVDVYKDVL